MFKNSFSLFNVVLRDMSKRCKLETLQNTVKQQINVHSNSANMKDNLLNSEFNKDVVSEEQTTEFHRFPTIPTKSANDKKEYSVIKLKNGLTALLVSDGSLGFQVTSELDNDVKENLIEEEILSSESEGGDDDECLGENRETTNQNEEKLAACSLTVGVGSFSDPVEVPGMAHFVEHMLFMGSKKYPEENYFDSLVKKLGGSDNASTECELTNFYFECPDENLFETMDVFSNFLISPLMTMSAMLREREAVEAEFVQNIPDDHYRRQQVLMASAAPDNPAGKFVWGNLKTLKDNVTDSFLYDATHTFWNTKYSSHKMTLAVQARLPLETLEKMVARCFSDIPLREDNSQNNVIEKPMVLQTPFTMSTFHKMYYVESVKDNIIVELNWVMPPVKHLFRSKPTSYTSFMIGHEGKGSLLSYLKKKHWAISLEAGHDEDDLASNKLYSIFTISVHLTELGANNLQAVLRTIFSYINMLQNHGPDERIWKEVQQIEDLSFRFQEESQAAEYVDELSHSMQIYPIEHYINGNELLFDYNPDEISKFLNCLNPSTVNVLLLRRKHDSDINLDKVEPWFTTNYTIKDIPEEWLKEWSNAIPYPEFHIPEPNKYIASDFTIHTPINDDIKYPEQILNSNNLKIWYKPDTKFKVPTGFIGFQFINKNTIDSALNTVVLKIYTELLIHLLSEELYPSEMARLKYQISEYDGYLIVEVFGFNQKLHILLDKIAEYIQNFRYNIDDKLTDMYKETRKKAFYNKNCVLSNIGRDVRLNLILENYFTSADKYNIMPQVDIEMIKKFSEEFFNTTQVQCLVQGNILKEEALSLCENFVKKVLKPNQEPVEVPQLRIYKLPNGEKCCKVKSFDKINSNCVTVNYYQLGAGSLQDYCGLDLLMLLMEEPLFDQLRTQEQLGYEVSCSIREMHGVMGFTVTVVSHLDKQSIDHVEERITIFLNNFLENLKKMPLEDFNRVLKSLITLKQCCDLHLRDEVTRNWSEIKTFQYAFNRLEQEQNMLAKLTPSDVIALLEQSIQSTNPNFRKLSVQVEGYQQKDTNLISDSIEEEEMGANDSKTLPPSLKYKHVIETSGNKDFIEDISDFKSKLDFYPRNKIFT